MSEEYKQHIDKLVEDANKGDTKACKQLLEETNKWNKLIDKAKEDRDKNKAN